MRMNPTWLTLLAASLGIVMCDNKAQAAPIQWEVRPKICIVESMGDECEIVLNISAQDLPQGRYCFYQNEALLNCWHANKAQKQVRLRFSEPTELVIKNENNEAVFIHSIDLKARESTKRTRRVRQPWSLF